MSHRRCGSLPLLCAGDLLQLCLIILVGIPVEYLIAINHSDTDTEINAGLNRLHLTAEAIDGINLITLDKKFSEICAQAQGVIDDSVCYLIV